MQQSVEVIVVGAGLSGIAAAAELRSRGRSVRVLEKSRGIGGRMANRRSDLASFDHGAQFFTTRSPEFTEVVEEAVDAGAVEAWTHGFDDPADGYPRWRGVPKMTSLARWMSEVNQLDVELGVTVTDLRDHPASAYLLTAPVPQSLAVLSFSQLLPAPALHAQLANLAYKPTIAVLLDLAEAPPGFPDHGGIQFLDHPDLAFLSDNQRKGVSSSPAITAHLSNQLSGELWNAPDDEVVATTLEHIASFLGGVEVIAADLQRWRYAGPEEVWPERTVLWGSAPTVALAGEAFGGPKVEGAFLSGRAAAVALDEALE